jgi:hypothetical protein
MCIQGNINDVNPNIFWAYVTAHNFNGGDFRLGGKRDQSDQPNAYNANYTHFSNFPDLNRSLPVINSITPNYDNHYDVRFYDASDMNDQSYTYKYNYTHFANAPNRRKETVNSLRCLELKNSIDKNAGTTLNCTYTHFSNDLCQKHGECVECSALTNFIIFSKSSLGARSDSRCADFGARPVLTDLKCISGQQTPDNARCRCFVTIKGWE